MLMEHLMALAAEPSKHCRQPARFRAMGRRTRIDAQRSHLQAWWRHAVHLASSQPAAEGLGNFFTDLSKALTWKSLKKNQTAIVWEMALFWPTF